MSRLAVEKARELHERHPGMSIPLEVEVLAQNEGCELIDWPFLEPVKEVKQGRWIGIAQGLNSRERRHLIAHALAHHHAAYMQGCQPMSKQREIFLSLFSWRDVAIMLRVKDGR